MHTIDSSGRIKYVGVQGATGSQGATGPQGSTGPQGASGPQGATGAQGVAGTGGADIGCRCLRSTTQSISDSTTTVINWDAEDYDTDTMHSTSTNNERITIVTAGKYWVSAVIQFASNTTGSRIVFLSCNASGGGAPAVGPGTIAYKTIAAATGGNATEFAIAGEVMCSVGDYIQVAVWQNSGGSLNINRTASVTPTVEVRKVAD